MAISFVGGTANGNGNGVDATLTLPSMAQDDLVIVTATCGYIGDLTMAMTTSGYTLIAELLSSDSRTTNFAAWYKFMGGSPDATAVITGSAITTTGIAAAALALRGVKLPGAGGPFSTAEQDTGGINGSNPDPPSIATAAGDWVVAAVGGTLLTDVGASIAAPSGYATNWQSFIQAETTICYVGAGYDSAPSNPENPGTTDVSAWVNTSDSWSAICIALAQGAPPTPPTTMPRVGRGRRAGN